MNDAGVTASGSIAPAVLVVYGREACHLCQEMVEALYQLQQQENFNFEIVDIDSDAGLVKLYNDRVPVLVASADKKEICHYYLDTGALKAYLTDR